MKILTLLFLFCSFSANAECAPDLAGATSSSTQSLIGYFSHLLDQRIVDVDQLRIFVANGALKNPVDATNTAQRIHARAIDEYLAQSDLRRDEVLAWARTRLQSEASSQENRGQVRRETARPVQQMRFEKIGAGSFRKWLQNEEYVLNHPIEVMNTSVTWRMWTDVMGVTKPEAEWNLPATGINWYSALEFANRLSLRDGYAPAYLFGDMLGATGSFENGDWNPHGQVTIGKEIKINAPDGDYYRAQGYRLPTSTEHYLLMTGRGTHEHGKFPGVTDHNIAAFANVDGEKIVDVASFEPIMVDGKAIFDLIGNVWEWGMDGLAKPGLNPIAPVNLRSELFLLGGDFTELGPRMLGTLERAGAAEVRPSVGFRLVRTLE